MVQWSQLLLWYNYSHKHVPPPPPHQAKEVSQIGMMWNEMFSPEQAGPFFPVSRSFFDVWPIFDWGACRRTLRTASAPPLATLA